MRFDSSICFYCGDSLDEKPSSEEHVIPRWAQRRYDLWSQRIDLLNNTSIPYRQLTVPCCLDCNKYQLSPIESLMSSATLNGPEAVRKLGDEVIYLWLGKIFYGLLFKEFLVLTDRTDPNGQTIVTREELKSLEHHIFLLQAAREKVTYVDFLPGSVFVFRTQCPESPRFQWDLSDNVDSWFIGIRMGEVGLIGCLGDGGAMQLYENEFQPIINHPLHPFQFRELMARISYDSTLSTRTPKHIIAVGDPEKGKPHEVFQMPLGGMSLKPLFDNWVPSDYATYLAHYTGLPYDYVYEHPNLVRTWIFDEKGHPVFIDYKKIPEIFEFQ